jgi:hypothetical protein
LYIQAFSCRFPEVLNAAKITREVDHGLTQIWPVRHSFIRWPTLAFGDRAADQLAHFIFDHLDVAGRLFAT